MKRTGIIRRVDALGRIVIPMEVRKNFNIAPLDELEIYIREDSIVLKKPENACTFCSGYDGRMKMEQYRGQNVCERCWDEIRGK